MPGPSGPLLAVRSAPLGLPIMLPCWIESPDLKETLNYLKTVLLPKRQARTIEGDSAVTAGMKKWQKGD